MREVVYRGAMRKSLVVALVLSASLSIAACKPAAGIVPTDPASLGAPNDAGSNGSVFEPEPTAFTILFPAEPEQKTSPLESEAGTMIQHEAWASYRDSYYAIAWMDFPPSAEVDTKKALDGARDGAVKGGGDGRIRTEKTIKAGEATGRDVVFDVSSPIKATGYLRIYIAGMRFYQTLVVQPATRPDAASAAKFLDSFVVK